MNQSGKQTYANKQTNKRIPSPSLPVALPPSLQTARHPPFPPRKVSKRNISQPVSQSGGQSIDRQPSAALSAWGEPHRILNSLIQTDGLDSKARNAIYVSKQRYPSNQRKRARRRVMWHEWYEWHQWRGMAPWMAGCVDVWMGRCGANLAANYPDRGSSLLSSSQNDGCTSISHLRDVPSREPQLAHRQRERQRGKKRTRSPIIKRAAGGRQKVLGPFAAGQSYLLATV